MNGLRLIVRNLLGFECMRGFARAVCPGCGPVFALIAAMR